MWSLTNSGSAYRSCRSLVLHQRTLNAPWAAQYSFSTALIAHVKATNPSKMEAGAPNYDRWTKDGLIKRIQALEREVQAKSQTNAPTTPAITATTTTKTAEVSLEGARDDDDAKADNEPQKKGKKVKRGVDPSKYATRLIALKLAYLGKNYGGFEYQPSANISTIEEELWKAMVKACLIFPENPNEVNWDPWEYSKCGRTDRGVSAFGQVIGIRVRSNRPLPPKESEEIKPETSGETAATDATMQDVGEQADISEETEKASEHEFDDFTDELPYPRLLNRLLPPDIRILAWCPTTPAGFSARHHCRERQYRYFFTQPAFSPMPDSLEDPRGRNGTSATKPKDGWLDIDAMRAAAKKYEGLHDFRNFCKIDGSKQLQSYQRRIFESDIVEVPDVETALPYLQTPEFQPSSLSSSPSERGTTASPPPAPSPFPKVYYFHVRGSAFLWHQIRCMVSILFSVGQGLEPASIVDRLLDITAEPRRPAYTMAHETPLVLWDCFFPRDLDGPFTTGAKDDSLEWVHVGEDNPLNAHGSAGVVDHLWERWREHKMDELLASQLLGLVASKPDLSLARRRNAKAPRYAPATQKVFEGGNRERGAGKYVPLLKKARLASPLEAYDKEARRRGFRDAKHMQEVGALRKAQEVEAEAEAEAEGWVEVKGEGEARTG